MIILDTNVISEVFRRTPEPRVVDWLESLTSEVAITAVTYAELLAGVRRLPAGRRRSDLEDLIRATTAPYRADGLVLPFDDDAADAYGDIVAGRMGQGLPISTADAMIAAISRSRGARCTTRNVKDFAGCGVDLVNPFVPQRS